MKNKEKISKNTTVKPVFKGHSDERIPCEQVKFSQNSGLSPPC